MVMSLFERVHLLSIQHEQVYHCFYIHLFINIIEIGFGHIIR